MRIKAKADRSEKSRRGAFTLIELMVVITIIVALMALSASAVLKLLSVQQVSNTNSTLDRVQSQLNKAWSKVKDQANSETIPPAIYAQIQSQFPMIDANAALRIRIIYVKLKLRAAFPMTFGEAFNVPYSNPTLATMGGIPTNVGSSPVPGLPAYTTYLTSHGVTQAAVMAQASPDPRESSVCLLMALQRGVSGAGINPEDLTSGGASGMYSYGGNPNGMPYLTDAWARPIFFSRAPSGSFYLNPLGPTAGNNDPGDPQGLLQTPAFSGTYGPLFTQLTLQPLRPNVSYKLAPMVASGGTINWTKTGVLTFNPITFAPVSGDPQFSTP